MKISIVLGHYTYNIFCVKKSLQFIDVNRIDHAFIWKGWGPYIKKWPEIAKGLWVYCIHYIHISPFSPEFSCKLAIKMVWKINV